LPANYYELLLDSHRFTCEFRSKIIKGWCYMFAATTAAFAWALKNEPSVAWGLPVFTILATGFIWVIDFRHRGAHKAVMRAGKEYYTPLFKTNYTITPTQLFRIRLDPAP
jgi:hypothetical protein